MRRILPLLAVLCLAFAPLPFPKPDRSDADLKALQGEWHRALVTIDRVVHSEVGSETTIVIAGDRMKYSVAGRPTNEWEFTLDRKARPPRFDRKGLKGHAAGLTYLGIYRIDGDGFTLCSRDGHRPEGFDATGGSVFVEVYRRK
jgi:uncharacterized protein (TIGR03067 family)